MFARGLEGWHIIILAIVILLLFGWKKMPDMARSFGRSARILKSEMGEMKDDKKSQGSGQTVKGEAAGAPTTGATPANDNAEPVKDAGPADHNTTA